MERDRETYVLLILKSLSLSPVSTSPWNTKFLNQLPLYIQMAPQAQHGQKRTYVAYYLNLLLCFFPLSTCQSSEGHPYTAFPDPRPAKNLIDSTSKIYPRSVHFPPCLLMVQFNSLSSLIWLLPASSTNLPTTIPQPLQSSFQPVVNDLLKLKSDHITSFLA